MSFSLEINHGDLVLNGGDYASVSETQKLIQDLRCAILTPLGFYENYQEYGSDLENIIGESDWKKAASIARSEIQRVCGEYQSRQISRNQADAARYGRPTITANETLLRVNGIEMFQIENHLIAKVKIQTGTGEFELNLPVGEK